MSLIGNTTYVGRSLRTYRQVLPSDRKLVNQKIYFEANDILHCGTIFYSYTFVIIFFIV